MKIRNLEIKRYDDVFWIVKNIKNNKYVKLGKKELRLLLELLEVEKDLLEIQIAECLCAEELKQNERIFMLNKFDEWGFIETKGGLLGKERNYKKNDLSKIKLLQINPNKLLQKIPYWLTCFFSAKGLMGILIFSLLKYYIIIPKMLEFCNVVLATKCSIVNIFTFFILLGFSTIFHEFGHALSCMHYGGKVSSMGILLYFLFPAMYCDVSDIYMLRGKKVGICVSLSGICANILFGNFVFWIYYSLDVFVNVKAGVLLLFLLVNFFVAIFNLFPFVKYDGYWMISSLLGMTNMMEKATILVIASIFNKEKIPKDIPKKRKYILTIYGGVALVIRPLFWIYTIYSVSSFMSHIQVLPILVNASSLILIALVFFIEFQFWRVQILKYKTEHLRILKLLCLS